MLLSSPTRPIIQHKFESLAWESRIEEIGILDIVCASVFTASAVESTVTLKVEASLFGNETLDRAFETLVFSLKPEPSSLMLDELDADTEARVHFRQGEKTFRCVVHRTA